MCGIVGYTGIRAAQPLLLKALEKLEYRGYDSCGIAVLGKTIGVYKSSGRVEALARSAPLLEGLMGIGHTRWATHGEPSPVNAHPHTDCSARFAVVHNGVIINYQDLKEELLREGHHFVSETDTEVIPHLIEKYYQGSLEAAVVETLTKLLGSYAIAVIAHSDDRMVVAKNGSPLVIGLGNHENMIASDIPPLLDYTRRMIYLGDGEIGVITRDRVKITKDGREINKPVTVVSWNIDDVQKGGFAHFMLKEIHEQPRVIRQSLIDYSPDEQPLIGADFIGNKGDKGLLILGCGTSFHAGLVAKYLIEELLDIPVRAELASEVNHRERMIPAANVIAITQSGETADVLISMKKLMEAGCFTLAITNVKGSSASRLATKTLYTQAGPELSVAATKSFMAQLIELYKLILMQPAISLKLKQQLNLDLRLMPNYVQRVLDNEQAIEICARQIAHSSHLFYIGRGINYPVALEGALKIKEISYIHAEGYAAGELKHGPFSLLQPDTPVIAIVNRDFTYDAMITNIKEIKSRKAPLMALVGEDDHETEKIADMTIRVPNTHSLLSPVVNTVALQLLAYHTANELGCPVDFPRNLAKSVTVE
jgi:glucosamine--fructose-6-phosphate aminotransferase (isomerizing)